MKHYHCPVNGWDCPYYRTTGQVKGLEDEDCLCTLENPYSECDDFYSMWGDDCDDRDFADYKNNQIATP